MRCEALIREQYGYRGNCLRDATKEIKGHHFCTQHANQAKRRRMVWLVGGGFLKVEKKRV